MYDDYVPATCAVIGPPLPNCADCVFANDMTLCHGGACVGVDADGFPLVRGDVDIYDDDAHTYATYTVRQRNITTYTQWQRCRVTVGLRV